MKYSSSVRSSIWILLIFLNSVTILVSSSSLFIRFSNSFLQLVGFSPSNRSSTTLQTESRRRSYAMSRSNGEFLLQLYSWLAYRRNIYYSWSGCTSRVYFTYLVYFTSLTYRTYLEGVQGVGSSPNALLFFYLVNAISFLQTASFQAFSRLIYSCSIECWAAFVGRVELVSQKATSLSNLSYLLCDLIRSWGSSKAQEGALEIAFVVFSITRGLVLVVILVG